MSSFARKPNDINGLGARLRAMSTRHATGAAVAPIAPSEALETVPNASPPPPSEAIALPPMRIIDAPAGLVLGDGRSFEPGTDPMRRFLAGCRSPRTAQTMLEALERIAGLLGVTPADVPWPQLRRIHVDDIAIQLGRRYSKRTVNVTLAALRGVLRTAWEIGHMDGDDYTRAVAVRNLKVNRLPKGRGLLDEEIERIAAHCQRFGPDGAEWPAAFALLLGAGLRASEAANLPVAAYSARAHEIRFIRKGDKEAIAPLGDEETAAVEEWLAVRAELAPPVDNLLVRVHRDGSLREKTIVLDRRKLEFICKQAARDAGVAKFSPHDLRRTFCTTLLAEGTDLATVQRLMSHESPETTSLYDRRGLEADAAARRRVTILGRKVRDERPQSGAPLTHSDDGDLRAVQDQLGRRS
jgi:integrase